MDDAKAQELIEAVRAVASKLEDIDRSIENVWRGIDNLSENMPEK